MLQWLSMDRSSLPRRHHYRDSTPALSTKPPPISSKSKRDKAPQHALNDNLPTLRIAPASPTPETTNKLRKPRPRHDHLTKGHKRSETAPTVMGKHGVEEEQGARHFMVANVGAGGTLYLKPTRVPVPITTFAPATPPATSDGESSVRSSRPLLRDSDISRRWTPRPERARSAYMASAPTEVVALDDTLRRRRTRSHSESTVGDSRKLAHYDGDEPPLPSNENARRRSHADLSRGLSMVEIPHYRLGTPRFSARGTAYLHYSVHNNSTGGVPSSILSRAEYDKLFPVPPERDVRSFYSHVSGVPFLHPSSAYSRSTVSRNPIPSNLPSTRPSTVGIITPALFNKLEANLDDPAVVHYHPTSGRIVAATPARLIAQITSPRFLDYELLADFFLTFRCFMPCRDVLEFLFARMRWAFESREDSGRIARVRTFVALRHWILNYFADDFMVDLPFRQNFCDLVNDLAKSLRLRADRGGGDINIIGELKKCWRRTSAQYWATPDAHESSPDTDIVPGGEPEQSAVPTESALSLPLTIRPTTRSHSIFEMTQIQLPQRPEPYSGPLHGMQLAMNGPTPRSTATTRTASIPASPISEQSLEVLSCSVPFLRNIRPTARPREKQQAPPRALQTQGKTGKPTAARPRHGHKRSGSFSDALRDKRTPLSSPKVENIELKDLPSFSITGGLVRGILLQPSPATVDNNVPVTPGPPGPEFTEARLAADDGFFGQSPHHNLGVKKFVGEVRRALSSRKGGSESPARSLGSASSGSESRARPRRAPRKPQPDWQQLPGPSRLDVLGVKIQDAYTDAIETTKEQRRQTQTEVSTEPAEQRQQHMNGIPAMSDEQRATQKKMLEKALPDPPSGPQTPKATDTPKQLSLGTSEHDSVNVLDFGRLNSHVTTGSRSIVIVDATGNRREPTMSGALPSMSSKSSDMMPIPLFRDRNGFPPAPPLPKDYTDPGIPGLDRDSRVQSTDEGMHELLTSASWDFDEETNGRSRSNVRSQRSNLPRRSSSLVRDFDIDVRPMPHQIRRRPGGDLKAADHVRELESPSRSRGHRLQSDGTLSLLSHSQGLSNSQSADLSATDGTVTPSMAPRKKESVSLIQTPSSQPILRPSFVGEAQRLKGLPDLDSDGGIEDALLKLEGKIPSPARSNFSAVYSDRGESASSVDPPPFLEVPSEDLAVTYANVPLELGFVPGNEASPTITETQGASIYHPSESGIQSMSSRTEYPLPYQSPDPLEPVKSSASSNAMVPMSVRLSHFPVPDFPHAVAGASPELEWQAKDARESVGSSRYPSYRPDGASNGSFLLDDNQSLSDISTEIASHHEDGVRSFYFDDTIDEGALPVLPITQPQASPPTIVSPTLDQLPDRRPLKRDPSRPLKETISAPKLLPQSPNQPFPRRAVNRAKTRPAPFAAKSFPAHLPFVLAFESEVIAEQLTIIEKDALDEVDWKDLISLNWQQTPPDVRNWVDYLNKENANGIDIVIARFNLVVKWCVSEIVLTELPSERARAITKYIHIAAHCHRLHNFSSMYQIVLALLSTDLARLKRTWSLVALREKQMLEQLEQLCRPFRNFYNLRAEMETAMPGNGIIPFIGLYTHDLMFNALKSPRINSPAAGKEALVNFERFQTAATIVKNLLRLVEASSRYAFHPEPEALARCLWIAALDDEEIDARSKALEQT